MTYFLGIDGGGSTCSARLEGADGSLVATAKAGPANVSQDEDGAIVSLVDVCEQLSNTANLGKGWVSQTIAVIGLAGYSSPEQSRALCQWARRFANVWFTSDLPIACAGAHGVSDAGVAGGVIIVGTGSAAYARNANGEHYLGGHGFLLGDQASGAWLGKQAISYTLQHLDGLAVATLLSDRLQESCNIDCALQLRQQFLYAKSSAFAKLAPLVFECAELGDNSALKLIDEGARYIETLFDALCSYTDRISVIGGLSHRYQPFLTQRITSALKNVKGVPEQGAVWFARSLYKKTTPRSEIQARDH